MKKFAALIFVFRVFPMLLLAPHASLALSKPAAAAPTTSLEEEASAALIGNSKEVRIPFQNGREKLAKHDYPGAISEFTKVIKVAPTLAGAYNLRGLAKHLNGDQAGAEADYDAAIAARHDYPDPYLNRGNLKQTRGDVAGATADYQRVLKINPKDSRAYVGLGGLKFTRKDYAGAEADFNHALALQPGNPAAWDNRALVEIRRDHQTEAFADVNHAISLAPKDADSYVLRAEIEHRQGNPSGAITDYRRAVALNPKKIRAYYSIAYIEAQAHHEAAALADAQRCLPQPAGRLADYPQFLIWSLRTRLGRSGEADRQFTAYFDGRPHTADDEWAGHVGAFLLGRETEPALFAHAASGDTQKTSEQRCEAWYYAGLKKLFAGDKAAAAEHFHQCLATGQKTFVEYELAQAELPTL